VEAEPESAAERETAAVLQALERPPGPVAVGVGSRGVANLEALVRGVVRALRRAGWDPFIVPAMGSHGGATAAGQTEVLAGYGVTEAGVGAPVRAGMATVVAGEVEGLPVYKSLSEIPHDVKLDRISVYLPPPVAVKVLDDIAKKGCKELWVNPGAESAELVEKASRLGLNTIFACSYSDALAQ